MNNELISVIIPMYNVRKYIEKCIRSVLNGFYQNVEILCIDDGSVDDTSSIVKKLQNEDPRIKLYEQDHAGVSAARNIGLEEANGLYIAFIDADDWISKEYLSTLYKIASEECADIVRCDYVGIDRYEMTFTLDEDTGYEVTQINEKEIIKELVNVVWSALYRKDICPRFDEKLNIGEDIIFNIEAVSQNRTLIAWKCHKRMYIHYWRRDSLINSIGKEKHKHVCVNILSYLDSLPVKHYAIIDACKHALAFRYETAAFPSVKKHYKKEASELLKQNFILLLHCKEIPVFEKILYIPLFVSPHIYILFRYFKQKKRANLKPFISDE